MSEMEPGYHPDMLYNSDEMEKWFNMKKWKIAQRRMAWQVMSSTGDRNIAGHTAKIPESFQFIEGDGPRGLGIDFSDSGKISELAQAIIPQMTVSKRDKLCDELENVWKDIHGRHIPRSLLSTSSSRTSITSRGGSGNLTVFFDAITAPEKPMTLLEMLKSSVKSELNAETTTPSTPRGSRGSISPIKLNESNLKSVELIEEDEELGEAEKGVEKVVALSEEDRPVSSSSSGGSGERTQVTKRRTSLRPNLSKAKPSSEKGTKTFKKSKTVANHLLFNKTGGRKDDRAQTPDSGFNSDCSNPEAEERNYEENEGDKMQAILEDSQIMPSLESQSSQKTLNPILSNFIKSKRVEEPRRRSLNDEEKKKMKKMEIDEPKLSTVPEHALLLLHEQKSRTSIRSDSSHRKIKAVIQSTGICNTLARTTKHVIPVAETYPVYSGTHKDAHQTFTRRRTKGLMYNTLDPLLKTDYYDIITSHLTHHTNRRVKSRITL